MKPSPSSSSILIVVEDPGAANYVAPLPNALAKCGIGSLILAQGPAKEQLHLLNAGFEILAGDISVEAVLESRRPRLLLVGASENTDGPGLELIDLGKRLGIPTIGVVDGPANPELRFSGGSANPRRHAPDYVTLPDEQTRQAFIAQGYACDRAVNCGHPHYDFVRREKQIMDNLNRDVLRKKIGFDAAPGQKVIMFCAEMSKGLCGQQFVRAADYTLKGSPNHNLRTEIVLDEFLLAADQLAERPYMVLRLHPKNRQDEFCEYLTRFDFLSMAGTSLESVHASDLVVGMTSMILVEAALMERPTLSIIPRPSELTWLSTIALGITDYCAHRADIGPALAAGLKSQSPDTKALCSALPSDGTNNVVRLICSILSNTGVPN
jgi:hypothetical protein